MTLGQKLRFFRTAEGYSQKELADMLSIERSTYTYYELDQSLPNVYTMLKLARRYNVTVEFFADNRMEPFGGKEFLLSEQEKNQENRKGI